MSGGEGSQPGQGIPEAPVQERQAFRPRAGAERSTAGRVLATSRPRST